VRKRLLFQLRQPARHEVAAPKALGERRYTGGTRVCHRRDPHSFRHHEPVRRTHACDSFVRVLELVLVLDL
jgi:hypothetical protein